MRRIGLSGALALALATPAAATQLAQAAPDGAAAYAQACAACHRTPARFMRRYLEMPPAERAAIVAWLMQYQPGR